MLLLLTFVLFAGWCGVLFSCVLYVAALCFVFVGLVRVVLCRLIVIVCWCVLLVEFVCWLLVVAGGWVSSVVYGVLLCENLFCVAVFVCFVCCLLLLYAGRLVVFRCTLLVVCW